MEQSKRKAYYAERDQYYGVDGKNFIEHPPVDLNDHKAIVREYGIEPEPTDVEPACITEDGMLKYNRISREAEQMGRLHRYDEAEMKEGTLSVGDVVLHYRVPTQVTAYDAVPLQYTLTAPEDAPRPIHIAATTFEEPERCTDPDANYYDMNLPGKIRFDLKFDGYVVGKNVPGYAPVWSHKDFQDQLGTHYPFYDRSELIRSGTVSAENDLTWFHFTYENIGDTILDSMGNGSFHFMPNLLRKDENGVYQQIAFPPIDNWMVHCLDYCYPGEKGDLWLLFIGKPGLSFTKRYRLIPGEYRVLLEGYVRNEREDTETFLNYARGFLVCSHTFDFVVKEQLEETEPSPILLQEEHDIPRNKWLAEFEEFQGSYHSHKAVSADAADPTEGVLRFQPAPWDRYLTIKLILGDSDQCAMVRLPLEVESDSISIALNPDNMHYVEKKDGTREPMLHTQSMADMRGNVQMGPDATSNIINEMRVMQESGINMINTTMCYAYDAKENDCFKFMMDCARVMGFQVEAFAHYPFNFPTTLQSAEAIHGGPLNGHYNSWGHKDMNEANALLAHYSYQRYGDQYWMRGDGIIPLAGEDTWGWLTLIHDWRFGMTEDQFVENFQHWLSDIYDHSIDKLNQAYGSDYHDFSEIDPRKDGWYEESHMGAYTHMGSKGVFRERSRAIAELDTYRSILRLENYKDVLSQCGIPNAKFWIRYEGSGWLTAGIDPYTTNPVYRHQFYEQRRNAVIPEILAASGLVYGGSNYDGFPMTAPETYELTRRSSDVGLAMAKLPTMSYMCDVVINSKFGDPKFAEEYNLKSDVRGATVFTNVALFPYLKAMYEGGGLPGVMWQDYHCNGFVSSVQIKELKFYTKKIREMLATPEGQQWATQFQPADRSIMQGVLAKWSYPEEYIRRMVRDTKWVDPYHSMHR